MFAKREQNGWITTPDDCERMSCVLRKDSLTGEIFLAKGTVISLRSHTSERIGFLLSGRLRLFLGENLFEATDSACWCIPPGVDFEVEVLEDSRVLVVFFHPWVDSLPGTTA